MKPHFPLITCCLLLFSCGQGEQISYPAPSGTCLVTVTCAPEAQTAVLTRGLSSEEESRIGDVNLYAVNAGTGKVEHRYLHGSEAVPLTLIQGLWRFYAVANCGTDLGPLEAGTVEGLRADMPSHAPGDTDFLLPMAGRTEADISGPASVTLTLERLTARVRLDIRAAAGVEDELTVVDVQPINVPSGVSCFSGDAVGGSGDRPKQECGASAFSAVYYLPENLAGEAPHIVSPGERTHLNAPKDATGFRITALYEGKLVYYHVYPGGNDTSDFNLRRNRRYILGVTIYGTNPEDLRVTTCDLRLTGSFDDVYAGRPVPVNIRFEAENCTGITYDISCRVLSGGAQVTADGMSGTAGTIAAGLSGNAIGRDFGVSVECPLAGPVQVEFTVRDSRGGSLARILELTVKERPFVTCGQDRDSLYAYEYGILDLHVEQPGYTGGYTVTAAGYAEVYYDCDTPATEFTLPGNGDYLFGFRPVRPGLAALRLTLTDELGRSAPVLVRVVGLTARARIGASYTGGSLQPLVITVRSSCPVGEDLGVSLRVALSRLTAGGRETDSEWVEHTLTIPRGGTEASWSPLPGSGYTGYVVRSGIMVGPLSVTASRDRLYVYEIAD
ncbi:hypothetical protein [Alistipes finegoldii]|uniref:DUF4906 domain-containing protein n=1 Tax=Alistipes finegoldii TaxID=214856 RepID=UPI003AF79107